MADPTFLLQVEFVSGSWTNISSKDLLKASWERSLSDLFAPLRDDQALFELANVTGTYSPKKNANLVPGKRIRLKGTARNRYLSLPGTSGNYASTPDSAAVSITGDIDIRVKVAMDDWTPTNYMRLVGKFGASIAYILGFNNAGTGTLILQTSADSGVISSVATGFVDGSTNWLRATKNVTTGEVKFYTSDDGQTWTQLGTTQTVTAGAIADTADALAVGADVNGGGSTPMAGKIYYAELRNGIDGEVVASFDAEDADNTGVLSWASEQTGEVWTINQSGGSPAELADEDGTEYPLYTGRIREIKQSPGFGQQTALIEAMSEVDRIQRTLLTTPLFTSINAGSLFTEIMTRCAVASYACEALSDTINFATYRDRAATEALHELVRSGNYKLFLDGNGTMQMKGRYYGAFDDSQASLTEWHDLQYALSPDSVVNDVKLNGQPRAAATSIATLSHIGSAISIPSSGSAIGVWLAYTDPNEPSLVTPAQSVVTPVASTDWRVTTNADGTGTDLTSAFSLSFTAFGATAVATVTNNAATPGYLSRMQVRGYPVLRAGQLGIRTEDASSQAVYGRQGFEIENALIQSYPYLRDYAAFIIGDRKNPRDDVSHSLKNQWPEQLDREPGQVVSLIDSVTGINSQWTVKTAEHEVSLAAGLEHTTTYKVDVFNDRPWLVLDHPSFGKLDSGRQLAF